MTCKIIARIEPYDKNAALLALETGVDAIIVPDEHIDSVKSLAKCEFISSSSIFSVTFTTREDEKIFARELEKGANLVLAKGWDIIPVENLLAQPNIADKVCLEVASLEEAKLALGILERGVSNLVVLSDAFSSLRSIVNMSKISQGTLTLKPAQITKIESSGLGHRVCVDTINILEYGQGMLTGNSSAFTFLVHAETEHNTYVNSRPFRINAGAVHAYALMPQDKTSYLQELCAGSEILVVDREGICSTAIVGRAKVEVRPMLYIEAQTKDGKTGSIFLQNAETIRLVRADRNPVSVVELNCGDSILCHLDDAGRHFGMRINENITEQNIKL